MHEFIFSLSSGAGIFFMAVHAFSNSRSCCMIFFFFFTVKALQEIYFSNLPPPPPQKKRSNGPPLTGEVIIDFNVLAMR